MGRARQKQPRGENQGNRAPNFKVPNFRTPDFKVRKFAHPKPRCEILGPKEEDFAHPYLKVRNQFQGAKSVFKVQKPRNSTVSPAHKLRHLWNPEHPPPFISAMVKTRGGLSASPSSPTPRPQRAAMGAAPSPPVQAPAIPPSEGEVPSQRRYPTRRPPADPVPPVDQATSPVSRPPAKRTRFSGPGEPSHAPQPEPATEEPQIPVENTPETIIRHPMIAGPPIEGNLDCRDRPFHSEIYFDIEALRQQPKLRDSFRLLQRYHMESFLTPRQFYYPRVVIDFYQSMTTRGLRNPTLIQFTIDGRQGAIGARHIAEALRIPYEPVFRQTSGSGPHFLRATWSAFCPGDFYSLGSPAVPAPPELPRDEQISQAQQDEILTEHHLLPLQHTPQSIFLSLYILFLLSLRRLRAFIADTEHCSGFYYPPDGHYSGTPGSDHCYSGPAYHDPSLDSAASEYADSSWHDRSAPSEPLVPDRRACQLSSLYQRRNQSRAIT
ncbi:hypothetical protein CK203_113147 [Vitis vinifera]|uniref:Uncharacterized protein n=1 Tax=Vitis vinifera TaxID=29760 RepID=A0A438DNN2_VITVI|nr:hypothetical protein CK203_113147 [Vitis vinifera]